MLLRLVDVSKRWGDAAVLDRINLELRAGTAVGVAGGNGAGKTTLLRIAAGVITPDQGMTCFRGVNIEKNLAAYQQKIGFLSAGDRGLYARLTVRQNLDFWGGLARLRRRHRQRRTREVLREFEIDELTDRRVDRLSMGQRQRVRLAMTFLHEPTIVFLDEPTTSLDEAGVAVLDAALARLIDAGGCVLWVAPEEAYETRITKWWLLENEELRRPDSSPTNLQPLDIMEQAPPAAAR